LLLLMVLLSKLSLPAAKSSSTSCMKEACAVTRKQLQPVRHSLLAHGKKAVKTKLLSQ
jgi:hypothetical protein